MEYRLVTGLYVTNYICLAPELLLTSCAREVKCSLRNSGLGVVVVGDDIWPSGVQLFKLQLK